MKNKPEEKPPSRWPKITRMIAVILALIHTIYDMIRDILSSGGTNGQ